MATHLRLRRLAEDLHRRYALPVAGRNLLAHEEFNYGPLGRTPDHYKAYLRQWRKGPQSSVHIRRTEGTFEKDMYGMVQRVHNRPLECVVYPEEFHVGLWGGEGVVRGLRAQKPRRHWPLRKNLKPWANYWWPQLHQTVIYSEVLNKHMRIVATRRGETLVHRHAGLDAYLLETPVNEVYAGLLMNIKREILLALARGTLWPEDQYRREELLDRFKEHMLPEEEADWHGLSPEQAAEKQVWLERRAEEKEQVPLKHEYRAELLELLREGYLDDLDPQLLLKQDDVTLVDKEWIKAKLARFGRKFRPGDASNQ